MGVLSDLFHPEKIAGMDEGGTHLVPFLKVIDGHPIFL